MINLPRPRLHRLADCDPPCCTSDSARGREGPDTFRIQRRTVALVLNPGGAI
ncbi:hypothetical protein RGE_27760 [Rubrivivax gelatinosus IL144]|uniref:Uncharacterized protein n=1 Tax=Rubrivivax gelatinosus (strain NBRC 100245 / IL144) TaxID=983917 RepID=I0HSX8_RUBGI|nr:hypothetical protein RGE_27760 [Rubrivivax gelatinosus IL144]